MAIYQEENIYYQITGHLLMQYVMKTY